MKIENGQMFELMNQTVKIIKCENEDCEHLMVNLDAEQLVSGDLSLLKSNGLRISNPETDAPLCINCEVQTSGHRLAKWFETDDDDDDDSSFFSSTPSSSGSLFGGSSGFGGFGGFGGGSFGGGGASRSF